MASLSRGLTQLRLNVAEFGEKYDDYLDDQIRASAVEGTAYMKTHAPWNDSTGNRKDRVPGAARAGLKAEPTKSRLTFGHSHKEITFSHSEWYGIFLETKRHGKNQVIMPSVKVIAERFMAKLSGSLDRVARGR